MAKVRYCTGESCISKNVTSKKVLLYSLVTSGVAYYYGWTRTCYAFLTVSALLLFTYMKEKNGGNDAMERISQEYRDFMDE